MLEEDLNIIIVFHYRTVTHDINIAVLSDRRDVLCDFQLLLETVSVGSREEFNRSVSIDSSIGRDTEFTFTYTGIRFPLDVFVTSPSGLRYTTDGPNGRHDTANKQVKISLNETEVRYNVLLVVLQ